MGESASASTRVQEIIERAKARVGQVRKHDWCTKLDRNEKGDARPTSANALMALQNADELSGLVATDELAGAVMLTRAPPVTSESDEDDGDEKFPRRMIDADVTAMLVWMQRNGLPTMSYDALFKAVTLEAGRIRYHPVRNWLTGLVWDGEERINDILPRYFRSDDTPYTRDVGRKFLVAMIARAMTPGCKMDYMLVLEGDQGVRKSTACSILGGSWFSDNLPDLRHGGKDVSQHIQGKWLIEVAEMSATDKADANALKSFITRPVERYRPSYGRFDVEQPRQCVFVGTTNKKVYMRDETGGRRFWPVRVGVDGKCDTEALRRDRDQIFAEAFMAWATGEQHWPSDDTQAELYEPEQEKRFESDEWETVVVAYLMDKKNDQIRLLDIAENALSIAPKDFGTTSMRRLTAIMERIGWERMRTNRGSVWTLKR
ncbi:hypothetical protein J2D73_18610 [Acetobacter sacchari]|uniref:Virulence-associated protein E-like domain-containing protein n=1 Tax=Acetobacter sacchari TaxID=2661687 RepID=A0ABS3M0U5_9PROT|nr:virulence-associated E family protein [Acetobacter sacchari]MBO1361798.1 hypothetical protein [Acetobacter sacchari]